AVDPWLHADEVATAAVHADTEGSDQPGSLAGGDFHCIICQTLGTTTQPSLSATPPQAMIWLDRPVRQNWTIPSTLAFIRAQPRGPPLSGPARRAGRGVPPPGQTSPEREHPSVTAVRPLRMP